MVSAVICVCGPDGIPLIVIKGYATELAHVLSKLYNKCLVAS